MNGAAKFAAKTFEVDGIAGWPYDRDRLNEAHNPARRFVIAAVVNGIPNLAR